MKDRVIAYLAQGFPQVKVASMCGCSEAYVSQVALENISEIEIEKKKIAVAEEEIALDSRYVKLESKVLSQFEANLPFAEFTDLTKAMGMLIQRRQKTVVPAGIVHDNRTQVVVLQLPQAAVPELLFNERKEVISVDGKPLAALNAPAVRELFERVADKQAQRVLERIVTQRATDLEEAILVPSEIPDDF